MVPADDLLTSLLTEPDWFTGPCTVGYVWLLSAVGFWSRILFWKVAELPLGLRSVVYVAFVLCNCDDVLTDGSLPLLLLAFWMKLFVSLIKLGLGLAIVAGLSLNLFVAFLR